MPHQIPASALRARPLVPATTELLWLGRTWTVLGLLGFFAAVISPVYLRNLELQRYVVEITRAVDRKTQSQDNLRTLVVDKARELNLPVKADNVHILRSPDNLLKIDVRYFVRVTLPGYTVDLHFHPGAESR